MSKRKAIYEKRGIIWGMGRLMINSDTVSENVLLRGYIFTIMQMHTSENDILK